ncbi:TylF/MycF family methyltransferase [Stakelama sp. CBK3Z-3]|uniref:TylF/MycF family methyltransferase n=1 Tax=Stakelama flava TaxID=2860338 RepID=A0ABS6XIB9_9SPHN|nr:TylF/MycF/NovP-related O-methyltransferase [Stakelama flava]MBW4329943.1 TylF/MycF family methyltransferase [Stakelama flava]
MSYIPLPADAAAEAENSFYLRGSIGRMGKLLAHLDLYRQIADLPGALVELGVYKGASLMRFAMFRALLEQQTSREIHGFDAFGSFPRGGVEDAGDRAFIERFEAERGEGISCDLLDQLFAEKSIGNVALHQGNVFETLPDLLARRPELRVALLHLDMDVYEPTAFAIEQLVPRMVPGGLILIDDYALVAGATRAADELVAARGLKLEKLRHYAVPAFIRMP